MSRTQHGTYSEKINDNILEIEYEYYYAPATHYDQEEESVDVTKVLANGNDITDFYWDFFDTEIMHDRILDYCRGF